MRLLSHLFEYFHAAHARHHYVENDQIEWFARKMSKPFRAVVRRDSIETFKREVVNEQSDEVDIVINDEKAAGVLKHRKLNDIEQYHP